MSNIDFAFIAKLEGTDLKGSVPAPDKSNSGVTIATGFDLGAYDEKDLVGLKLAKELIAKLKPYLGKKRKDAVDFLKANPLTITKAEAESINKASMARLASSIRATYDKVSAANGGHLKFDELIPEAQTVIASVAYQYGSLAKRTPKFWRLVTDQDFKGTVVELRNFGDAYKSRRNAEADLLEKGLARSNESPEGVGGLAVDIAKAVFKAVLGLLPTPAKPTGTPAKAPPKGAPTQEAGSADARCFPFSTVPKLNWDKGRAFGANREGGARAHGGCDLIFPVGTAIHAVADGTVIQDPYEFYLGSYALEVDHGKFIVRYGEIAKGSATVKKGDKVKLGEKIAKVGILKGSKSSMLHMEMYAGTGKGPLTTRGKDSAKRADGVPFKRRADLLDPTPFLNAWKKNLPSE